MPPLSASVSRFEFDATIESASAKSVVRRTPFALPDQNRLLYQCALEVGARKSVIWETFTITWGSVITTWMVARRVIENWLYWIVVDGVAIWLCYAQGLLGFALLSAVYVGIVVRGYFVWRRDLMAQRMADEEGAMAHVAT